MSVKTHYEILDIEITATARQVKESYRLNAAAWHPDGHKGTNKQKAEERMKLINGAYQVLRDPQTRMEYDNTLLNSHRASGGSQNQAEREYRQRTEESRRQQDAGARRREDERKQEEVKRQRKAQEATHEEEVHKREEDKRKQEEIRKQVEINNLLLQEKSLEQMKGFRKVLLSLGIVICVSVNIASLFGVISYFHLFPDEITVMLVVAIAHGLLFGIAMTLMEQEKSYEKILKNVISIGMATGAIVGGVSGGVVSFNISYSQESLLPVIFIFAVGGALYGVIAGTPVGLIIGLVIRKIRPTTLNTP